MIDFFVTVVIVIVVYGIYLYFKKTGTLETDINQVKTDVETAITSLDSKKV